MSSLEHEAARRAETTPMSEAERRVRIDLAACYDLPPPEVAERAACQWRAIPCPRENANGQRYCGVSTGKTLPTGVDTAAPRPVTRTLDRNPRSRCSQA
jgi:hypothetical protein